MKLRKELREAFKDIPQIWILGLLQIFKKDPEGFETEFIAAMWESGMGKPLENGEAYMNNLARTKESDFRRAAQKSMMRGLGK